VIALVSDVVGDRLIGAYLYGSAVDGGLKPASDLDLFAVTSRRTTTAQRRRLIDGLRPLSARDARPPGWRPVELSIVARRDVVPWRYPPLMEFISGEWLRARFDAGDATPVRWANPDLAVLIAQVRLTGRPLVGPPPADLLPEVPPTDLVRAMTDEIGSLLDDLHTDTANVLLTLARIWFTLESGTFAPKDVAADWAIEGLEPGEKLALERARETYRAGTYESWDVPNGAASATAAALVRSIRREVPGQSD
jgi:streptomycin 3"-adenylyltransferase